MKKQTAAKKLVKLTPAQKDRMLVLAHARIIELREVLEHIAGMKGPAAAHAKCALEELYP